jgi:hypothetical protein
VQIGVLNWFAKLWEIDTEEYWGYVTNCGTEGNLHGILVGRENLPDGGLQAFAMQQSMIGALLVTGWRLVTWIRCPAWCMLTEELRLRIVFLQGFCTPRRRHTTR